MGLREKLNKHATLYVSISLCVGLSVLGYSLRSYLLKQPPRLAPSTGARAFYTTDEGATLFVDQFDRETPFDHNGMQAVKADVFTCDGGKHQWVQFLEKWSDEGRKQLERMRSGPPGAAPAPELKLMLVKKPGSGKWLSHTDPAARETITPKCPDGMGSGPPDVVQP